MLLELRYRTVKSVKIKYGRKVFIWYILPYHSPLMKEVWTELKQGWSLVEPGGRS